MTTSNERLLQLSVLTALNRMLASGSFDITTFDNCAKSLGIEPEAEAYIILRNLHCVKYAEMPKELRDELPTLIGGALMAGGYKLQLGWNGGAFTEVKA